MRHTLKSLFLICTLVILASTLHASARPKVRAITAFVAIDHAHYKAQVSQALTMLRSAKATYEKAGYEVETIRITTQPFPEYVRGMPPADALKFFEEFDKLTKEQDVLLNIGPATSSDDVSSFELLGAVLAHTENINASAMVAGADGIHWNAIRASAKLVKFLEDNSPRSQANFSFAATAMMPAYAPFFPGSWHRGSGHKFAVGLESANVVEEVFAATGFDPKAASTRLKAALAKEAIAVDAIAQKVGEKTGWEYLGLDPTPAPLKDVSIGTAMERLTGGALGDSGTMTAAFIITDAVKSVPVKQTGYSGLMLPVLEDSQIARRWSEGKLTVDSLLAYSSVCGTGLDTIPLPGDVTEDQLARMIGDVATLAYKWKKPLTARLLPVKGRKAGEMSEFDDPYLVNVVLQKLP